MQRQMRFLTATASAILTTLSLPGAQGLQPPDGWRWVTDTPAALATSLDPPAGSLVFGTMAPGWHITSGPAATLFEPSATAEGRYSVESEVFLFPGTSVSGFGIFVGGRDHEARGGRYVAFLIRRDGSAAVERREDGRATLLHPWTTHASIKPNPGGTDAVGNVLRVEAEAGGVSLLVNGTKVLDVPRTPDTFDGIVGLRIGADLNLHVTNLDITRRLALPRRAKG